MAAVMAIFGGEDGDEAKLQVKPAVKHGGVSWRWGGGVEAEAVLVTILNFRRCSLVAIP
jgi:hypothetical protein